MKLLDYLIVSAFIGCFFIGYSGHRFVALLLLMLFTILASWRFYDKRREREMMRTGSSGELNPEHDNWADVRSDGDVAGDAGGHD
jgi:hypothetical protein